MRRVDHAAQGGGIGFVDIKEVIHCRCFSCAGAPGAVCPAADCLPIVS
jgi:hypothetical protein